ncbi:MAG TPA: dTDP-4-dehydrorhamnose 3,5-epimerase family protein [Solirubrobacteraceae bacterium]|nr:dTDP-4-dehydrorhamnose 3,5-epimerase family protein [Solirubrobacteraceae bacterium]
MRFTELEPAGAYLIELDEIRDERGLNARLFCEREFAEAGLVSRMVQTNLIVNARAGTLRGFHFQVAPHREAKLFRVVSGSLQDVIIDLRPGSPTYGQWTSVVLDARVPRLLYVPEGFGQGFLTLEDDTALHYQVSAFYTPAAGRGIRWDDPAFAVEWERPVAVVSEKDASWPDFSLDAHAAQMEAVA